MFFITGLVKGLSLQNEQLPLTYGLGNTIKGTNGTIATINTSASQAKDQINYGIWQRDGYKLKFESVNSDYAEMPPLSTVTQLNEIDFKCNVSYLNGDYSSKYFFAAGDLGSGRDKVIVYRSDRLIGVLISKNGSTVESNFYRIDEYEYVNVDIEFSNLEFRVNGDLKHTFTDWSIDFLFNPLNRQTTIGIDNTYNGANDCIFHSFRVQNEQFNLTEGKGNTTTGTNGTVATLNTSAAQANDYIDDEMWQDDDTKKQPYKKQ